ncbi:MAG: dTDP-4-dehydrorhamnose 3,5-epimerase family protein [Planctomycetes bacterium]|nr:dTDP-4-dehydrorhamnose 3,5-epimerase family protein [Planctomycetota bacterium]
MKYESTLVEGCTLVTLDLFPDNRGSFTKIFNESMYKEHGIDMQCKEQFYSTSRKNVLRGMHFQSEPHAHSKLIICMAGSVLDVVLDIRKDSATFGKTASFHLEEGDGKAVFIPEGLAHGFLSLHDNSVLFYNASSEQQQSAEGGIMWNSFGFDWPCKVPILSERDTSHESFDSYARKVVT